MSRIGDILNAVDKLISTSDPHPSNTLRCVRLSEFETLRTLRESLSIPLTDVEFTFTWEPSDIPIEGNAGEGDAEQWVKDQLAAGNEAAWFDAKVTATYMVDGITFIGEDHLGACSYESFADFQVPEGSYEDMCQQAYTDLLTTIETAGYKVSG